MDGFQPPELDGAPVPPVCWVVTVAPALPTAVVPVPTQPPLQPHPDPTPKAHTTPLTKRNQLRSLLIFLQSIQRGAAHKPAQRARVMGTSRRHGSAAVLPWWKVLSQDGGGIRLQGMVRSVHTVAWGQLLQKSSESDSSEELRG